MIPESGIHDTLIGSIWYHSENLLNLTIPTSVLSQSCEIN